MAIWYGFNPPFLNGTSVLPLQQDVKLIKNDLIQLLLTSYGERVMRPHIGSPIPAMQFENFVDGDISTTRAAIIDAVNKADPRITIVDIKIKNKNDDNMVIINFYGKVNLDPNNKFNIEIGVEGNKGVVYLRAQ